MVCRTMTPHRTSLADRHRGPPDTGRIIAVRPGPQRRGRHLGARHRGAHIVDARTGQTPTEVASVTVVGPRPVGPTSTRTAAFAHGPDAVHRLTTTAMV